MVEMTREEAIRTVENFILLTRDSTRTITDRQRLFALDALSLLARNPIGNQVEAAILPDYEAALATQAPVEGFHGGVRDSRWIAWAGGACPVSLETVVDVIVDADHVRTKVPAGNFRWRRLDRCDDITHWRLHEPGAVHTNIPEIPSNLSILDELLKQIDTLEHDSAHMNEELLAQRERIAALEAMQAGTASLASTAHDRCEMLGKRLIAAELRIAREAGRLTMSGL